MYRLAVAVQNENKNVSIIETIYSIKKAGFENVFVQLYDEELEISQEEQIKLCKSLGLNIIFAHLGYQNINSIWQEGKIGDSLVDRYKDDIKKCNEFGIKMVVMHLTSGVNATLYNEIGLKRIKDIVEYAEKLGVKVAFENTKIKGYLEYVIFNLGNKNVGICFDSGHYHVHFNDEFDFDFFKNKIFALHLHDNDKSDDLHLLPWDGTINWEELVKKLKGVNYDGYITLELCYRYHYLNMSCDDFYKLRYDRGKKLLELFESKQN